MISGWRYRFVAAGGAATLAATSVLAANQPLVQGLAVLVPVFSRLPATSLSGGALGLAVLTTLLVVLAVFAPLFTPRPRRTFDLLVAVERRVVFAAVALAAVGYFDYTYRLPRTTLVLAALAMGGLLPAWFVAIRRRPRVDPDRAVVVGDDPVAIGETVEATDVPVVGYVAPGPPVRESAERLVAATDGGAVASGAAGSSGGHLTDARDAAPGADDSLADAECLGGLSRLDDVLVEYDVDTAILAFSSPDREEFFGTLSTCFDVGVRAMVHSCHADVVLTTGAARDGLVGIDLEPWDWQDYVLKRAFDVAVAAAGLVVLAPVVAVVAAAIKLDDGGSVLYRQQRTAEFGETFTVYKFRTMVSEGEDATPVDDDANDRITRVGRFLRPTHLDEIPQLLTILGGRMSVVGPRAAWVDEESRIEANGGGSRTEGGLHQWRQRWFVKPGLTGFAQINGLTSTDPEEKLRYDVAYIRNQSFWFDLRILLTQLWMVVEDALSVLR